MAGGPDQRRTRRLSEDEIRAALDASEPNERELLTTLARSSPIDAPRDAAPGTSPDRPVQRLLSRGLLRWIDAETVELPARVGQVLRGEAVFDPSSPTPPPLSGRKQKPADVNAAAAGEALELVRHCEDIVAALGDAPAPALKAGGVGVREVRRLSKATGVDEARVGLLLELLAAAGLIARGIPDPAPLTDVDDYWAPPSPSTAGSPPAPPAAGPPSPVRGWHCRGGRGSSVAATPPTSRSRRCRRRYAHRAPRTSVGCCSNCSPKPGGKEVSATDGRPPARVAAPPLGGPAGPARRRAHARRGPHLGLVAHVALSSPGRRCSTAATPRRRWKRPCPSRSTTCWCRPTSPSSPPAR